MTNSKLATIDSLMAYFTVDEIHDLFVHSSASELEQVRIIMANMAPEKRAKYKTSLKKRKNMFGSMLAQMSRERKP